MLTEVEFYCPRDRSHPIIKTEEFIVCPLCGIFEKEDIKRIGRGELTGDQVLSLGEKEDIVSIFLSMKPYDFLFV